MTNKGLALAVAALIATQGICAYWVVESREPREVFADELRTFSASGGTVSVEFVALESGHYETVAKLRIDADAAATLHEQLGRAFGTEQTF